MKITRIYNQKHGQGINIEVDHEFLFSLKTKNSLVDANLFVDKQLDLDIIKEILRIDIINTLKSSALEKSMRGNNSSKEIKRFLNKKFDGYIKTIKANVEFYEDEKKLIIENIIVKLIKRKYINDEESAKSFTRGRVKYKPRGEALIKQELYKKGYKAKDIRKAISAINPEAQLTGAMKLVEKKRRMLKKLKKNEEKQKIYNYLARKGYSSGIIQKVLDNVY